MTSTTPTVSETKSMKPARFDPTLVRYSPRWLGAGAAAGTLAALAVQAGGVAAAVALGAAGVAGAAYTVLVEPRRPVLERVTLRLPNLPPALEGLRIGQLSDMHLGQPYGHENTRWAVAQMVREEPDLLIMTGDFVSFPEPIVELPELLGPLHAPLGMYAVPGNHDYWEGVDEIRAMLEPLGVEFLINAGKRLSWRGGTFWLAGVDDMWGGAVDLDAALAHVPADAFTLLLAHAPDFADVAARHNIAVQFSGHTHGGHMCLPFLGWFCLPLHGMRYAIGHERVQAMQLYITRGLGGLPFRLGCPPEATIFTLVRE